MLRLTFQLLCGGRAATAARLSAMVVGVALVVLSLSGAWAIPHALDASANRIASRQPAVVLHSGAHTFLFQELDDTVGTSSLVRLLVATGAGTPSTASAWAPVGCPSLPAAGTSCVSPALNSAVRRDPQLARRLSLGRITEIGDAGLASPREYLVYQGVAAGQLTEPQAATGWSGRTSGAGGRNISTSEMDAEVALLVGVPGLLFLLVSASLSAATRVHRARALRLLGLTRGQLRFIAAAEGRLAGLIGAAIGLGVYRLALPLLAGSNFVGFTWFASDTQIGLIAAVVLVLVATIGTGMLTTWSTGRQLESSVRRAVAPARLWRLIPAWLAVVALAVLIAVHHAHPHAENLVKIFFVAAAFGVVGLIAALRPLTELTARYVGDRGDRVFIRLAARRLQVEAASSCRILTAAVGVVMVAAVGAAVLQTANLAAGHSSARQIAQVPSFELASSQAAAMERLPARAVAVSATTPDVLPAGVDPSDDPGTAAVQLGVPVVYSTCAAVQRFDQLATPCRDGTVYRVADADPTHFPNVLPVGTSIGDADHRLRIPLHVMRVRHLSSGLLAINSILVTSIPSSLPGGSAFDYLLGSSNRTITQFQDALADVSFTATAQFQSRDLDALRTFQIHAGVIRAGSTIGFLMCLCAFLVAVADRARERRRNVATLVAIGVPRRTIRSSQVVEILIPAGLGMLGAVVVGVLIGTTYLSLDGTLQHGFYAGTVDAALPLALAATVIVGFSGLVIGGRRVDPTLFRRE